MALTEFEAAIAAGIDQLLTGPMSRSIVYNQDLAGDFEVRAIVSQGEQIETQKQGALASIFVRATDFSGENRRLPKTGDDVTIEGKRYNVIDVINGGMGDYTLYLRWKRDS